MSKKKVKQVEPEILKIIEALGIGEPAKITYIKTGKLIFTVDDYYEGIRVIYSDAFLEKIKE